MINCRSMILCVRVCSYRQMANKPDSFLLRILIDICWYCRSRLLSRLFSHQFSMLLMCSQQSAPARALEEGYRGSQTQPKKEELYTASQLGRRPRTTAKKWTAAALVGVAGAIAVGTVAAGDGGEDWPHCHRCGGVLPRKCVLCGQNLPRPIAEAMQAASKCGQASGAAQNQKETTDV
nr:uncharacterized protein LOC109782191 isoform X1 [Aegilops tauschii subsp. strangulata]